MGLLGTDSQARLPSFSTGPVLAAVFRGDVIFKWPWPSVCCSKLPLMTTEGYLYGILISI